MQRQWRRFIASLLVIVVVAGTVLLAVQPTSPTLVATSMTGRQFLHRAQRASREAFTATYRVRGNASPFIDEDGTITLTSDPRLLPAKFVHNNDGVSGQGEYFAYVFTHSDGSIVQWIQKGAYVSWCLKYPTLDNDHLTCTGLQPDQGGNGFLYPRQPFVPTTLLYRVRDFLSGQPTRRPPVFLRHSRQFGDLHCLVQTSGVPHLETCINQRGFITYSKYTSRGYLGPITSTTTLETLSRRVTLKYFNTLVKPSGNIVLPPP